METDERLADSDRTMARAGGLQSLLIVPMNGPDGIIGALRVGSLQKENFGPLEIRFFNAVAEHVVAIVQASFLLDENKRALGRLEEEHEATVMRLAAAAEAHDPAVGPHQSRVREISELIARELGFKPEEARALTLLLLSWKHLTFPPQYIPSPIEVAPLMVVRVPAEAPIVPGAEDGRKIFQTRGCNQCHTIGAGKLIGPDLIGVGGRHPVEWLRSWLADPAAMIRANPDLAKWPDLFGGIVMPNQNLSPAVISAVIGYLQKL